MRWRREDGGCPRETRRRKVSLLLTIIYIFIEIQTPAKKFSAEEALQEMNEASLKEVREKKSQIAQAQ
jgi:hypothetical protein